MYKFNYDEDYLKSFIVEEQEMCLDFNEYQFFALNACLTYYMQSDLFWFFTKGKFSNKEYRIIQGDITKIRAAEKIEYQYNIKEINISLSCKKPLKIIYVYFTKTQEDPIRKIIHSDLTNIIKTIREADFREYYYKQNFLLTKKDYVGYFDFNWFRCDFGHVFSEIDKPKIVKTEIKYFYLVFKTEFFLPCINTIELNEFLFKSLAQFAFRCNLNEYLNNGKIYKTNIRNQFDLDKNNKGKLTKNYCDQYYNTEICEEVKEIISKFYSLNFEKKEIFLCSCISYASGLGLQGVEAVFNYICAIENLANYCVKGQDKSLEKLKMFLNDTLHLNINEDYINYAYQIRSSYAHSGVGDIKLSNTCLYIPQEAYDISDDIEELCYISLKEWLLNHAQN